MDIDFQYEIIGTKFCHQGLIRQGQAYDLGNHDCMISYQFLLGSCQSHLEYAHDVGLG